MATIEQPARPIRRFELLILRPLSLVLPVAVVFCLVKTAWGLAVVMTVGWLAVGAIGQSLPHRKEHPASELASGGESRAIDGTLSYDDAYALAKAIQRLTLIVGLGALFIGWKIGFRWYWTLVLAFASYFVAGLLSALCAAKSPAKQQLSEMSFGVPDWTEEEKRVLFGDGTKRHKPEVDGDEE